MLMLLPNVMDPFTLFKRQSKQKSDDLKYFFKGMICYWGLHYYGYFRELNGEEGDQWQLLDDHNVRVLG